MQHLSSNYRAGGVDNEAESKKIFHADRVDRGLGPLGESRRSGIIVLNACY